MSQPTPADVTVVIPAHNRPALVTACVESVLAQDVGAPARILVVDDASTDDTADAAEAAGAEVLRLTRNVRAAGARNRGLAEVTTPWVAFLDSDDLWTPGALRTLLAHASGRSAVSGTAAVFSGDDVSAYIGPAPAVVTEITDPGAMLRFDAELIISGAVLSTDSARAVGGFDETLRYTEDLEFWTRYLEHHPVRSIPETVLLYRKHEGGKSGNPATVEARRAIGRSFIGRPWWSRADADRYYGGQLWNATTRAIRARDAPAVARNLTLLAARPARVQGALDRRAANTRLREAYAAAPRSVAAFTSPALAAGER